MKITQVGCVLLKPFPWVLVKVRTDAGITGLGEAYHGAGVHGIISDPRFQDHLLGEDPMRIDWLQHRLVRWKASYSGAILNAISGVEMALWDIKAQALGVPIWQLLGGRFREKTRLYADCHSISGETPCDTYVKRAREAEAAGYTAIKFDIDPPKERYAASDLSYHLEAVEAVSEALKFDTELALDAHWAYTPREGRKILKALEKFRLLWVEDPIRPENTEAMAQITRDTSVPICTGENLYTRYGFRDLLQSQGADIISPDIAKTGGLGEAKRIAELADLYYIPVAPHNVGSPVETMAIAHLMAAIPNALMIEFYHWDNPDWWELIEEKELGSAGYITVRDKAGLGITLNEDAVEEHTEEDLGFF